MADYAPVKQAEDAFLQFEAPEGGIAEETVWSREEGELRGLIPKPVYHRTTMVVGWSFWIALAGFMLLMPNYVPYLNKHYAKNSCTTPTWQLMYNQNISCMDGADLTKLARESGRFNWRGQPAVCGCSQGVFGEDICPLGFLGHRELGGATVSNYIGTPTGTGAFAFFMAGPMLSCWWYGTGDTSTLRSLGCERRSLIWLTKASLLAFQMSLAIFEMATGCIFYNIHTRGSLAMILFGAIHFLSVAFVGWKWGRRAPTFCIFGCGIAAIVFALRFYATSNDFVNCNVYPGQRLDPNSTCAAVLANPWKPFYHEVLSILMIFAMPPMLITWGALF